MNTNWSTNIFSTYLTMRKVFVAWKKLKLLRMNKYMSEESSYEVDKTAYNPG